VIAVLSVETVGLSRRCSYNLWKKVPLEKDRENAQQRSSRAIEDYSTIDNLLIELL
jgi:hypothetical protein